jgi:hypothetical protein
MKEGMNRRGSAMADHGMAPYGLGEDEREGVGEE